MPHRLVSVPHADDIGVAGTGFFGKVSSHGDFVSRRLAPTFQNRWDGWLQAGLQASREALGPQWLATYLNSPIWRFALAPGVCGKAGCGGVMMPSVDRVGRHFPLTLAAATPTSLLALLTDHGHWYGRLEALALSSLAPDFSLEAFDDVLAALAAPGRPAAASGAAGTPSVRNATALMLDAALPLDAQLAAPSPGLLRALAGAALVGHSLWWTDGSAEVAPCVLAHRGLPDPAAFVALFDGQWEARGWNGNLAV
jgi:type VI secretion system protein ImpM